MREPILDGNLITGWETTRFDSDGDPYPAAMVTFSQGRSAEFGEALFTMVPIG
jgi:hypothetical protein